MLEKVFSLPLRHQVIDEVFVKHATTAVIRNMIGYKGSSSENDAYNLLLSRCAAGDYNARLTILSLIKKIVEKDCGLAVPPVSDELARIIYVNNYGLGVIDDLVYDKTISEIWVNGAKHVWIEKNGIKTRLERSFKDDEDILRVIRLLLHFDKKDITTQSPMRESRLLDGSRLTVIIPPAARFPYINIRKFESFDLSTDALLKEQSLSCEMADWIELIIKGRGNILIIGETSSGKTSLLKWLISLMDSGLRLGVIETNFELKIEDKYPDRNVFSYEERPEIGITMGDLFKKCLRSSPDVIICGEARGSEADELIRAMRRGHPGSIGTIHTNSPETSIDDLVEMINEDGKRRDPILLRHRVASAIDIVIQMHRFEDTGKRKIIRITEVLTNTKDTEHSFSDIFAYNADVGFFKTGCVSEALKDKLRFFNPSGLYDNHF